MRCYPIQNGCHARNTRTKFPIMPEHNTKSNRVVPLGIILLTLTNALCKREKGMEIVTADGREEWSKPALSNGAGRIWCSSIYWAWHYATHPCMAHLSKHCIFSWQRIIIKTDRRIKKDLYGSAQKDTKYEENTKNNNKNITALKFFFCFLGFLGEKDREQNLGAYGYLKWV